MIDTARNSDCRLIAVTAPAGYGKSTLLAEWATLENSRQVAWVSLDRFDDDPANLLCSFASAFWRAGLGSADLVLDMQGHGVSVLSRAAPRLAAQFRTCPIPFVLLLDDLHQLQSAICHDVLGVLISAVPRGSQLVTASRSEPPHLPRLIAGGDALEFGASDLALDAAGAGQIFLNAQVDVTPEFAATVKEQAEGWPAGLYMAALVAKKEGGRTQRLRGDDRYVADYLYRETLIRQPTAIQRFLRRSAVLDQLCAGLCEATLKSSSAADHLRHAQAQGLFTIPLDREREWYRYHSLFREFLLGELRHTEPHIIPTLHQRAADWYESNGSPTLAVEHLLKSENRDGAIRLVTQLAMPSYMAGQLSTVQRWYRTLGEANIERYPPLAVLRCWECAMTGDLAGAQRWAAFVDAASFDLEPVDGSASFDSARAMLRAGMCAAGPESMMSDADFAASHEPPWSSWHDTALWLLAEAHFIAGRVDKASDLCIQASAIAAARSHFDNVPICESHLAWLAMDRGDWQEAATRVELALRTIADLRMHDYVFSNTAFSAAARLALHQNDFGEAHQQLTRAMRTRPSATYLLPYHAVRARLQLASVYLNLADLATARQLLREIDDILRHRPNLGVLVDEVGHLRNRIVKSSSAGVSGALPLTPAELRLLPYLQTHLTADRIAERLFVSSHTVKTQVKSIYRKLGVSSRNDAVLRAEESGLLGP